MSTNNRKISRSNQFSYFSFCFCKHKIEDIEQEAADLSLHVFTSNSRIAL